MFGGVGGVSGWMVFSVNSLVLESFVRNWSTVILCLGFLTPVGSLGAEPWRGPFECLFKSTQ